MNTNFKIQRAFASFGSTCPYQCKHCYTYSDGFKNENRNNIDEIISELKSKSFNTIYISGYTENFIVPSKGIELIEKIYYEYNCNILFTTRNSFSNEDVLRLSKLNKNMKEKNALLIACVSISALDSYKKLEPNKIIPTPHQRIDFIHRLYNSGIKTVLTLRPVCPAEYIPTDEYLKILEMCNNNCSAVISSGIVLSQKIKENLIGFPENIDYVTKPIMNCLQQQNLLVDYVDTSIELKKISDMCNKYMIPFFDSSIPAVEYLYKEKFITK